MPSVSTYQTPGVYVEWLDANAQHVEMGRTDVAGFVGITERGPLHDAIKIESTRQFLSTFGGAIAHAYLFHAVEGFFANGGRTCWIVRVADPARAARARVRVSIAHTGGKPFVLAASSPGSWGNAIDVETVWRRDRIVALIATENDRPAQRIELDATTGLPRSKRDFARQTLLGVPDNVLQELQPDTLIEIDPDDQGLPFEALGPGSRSVRLRGGADGLESLEPKHFTGEPHCDALWGLAALERVDGIAFIAVPDLQLRADQSAPHVAFKGFAPEKICDVQIKMLSSCMARRDRIAILDAPCGDRNTAIAHRENLPKTSSFGALYHPWIVVNDPLGVLAKGVRAIPPSGHIAGVFARTDRLRGIHKPPANEVLEGVWDVTEPLDDDAHGILNDAGVNAIRALPGRDVRVLGVRTLFPGLHWRYVNVRRLFAMIEEALDEQMQWLTFEPNNPRLWKEIDRCVRGFLERLYRAGMLDGATSDAAYFVRCDESMNPPTATDEGRVTCELGFQPPFPAEFVIVRIGVTRSGIHVEEKGTQDV